LKLLFGLLFIHSFILAQVSLIEKAVHRKNDLWYNKGMKLTKRELTEILVEAGFVNQKQLNEAFRYAKENDTDITEALVVNDIISDTRLGKLIAEKRGYTFVDLSEKPIREDVLHFVPEIVARVQHIIPFAHDKNGLHVAMNNPEDVEMMLWIRKRTGEEVIPYFATARDIVSAIKHYHKNIKEELEEIVSLQAKELKTGDVKPEDVSIIKLVDTLIRYAQENRASDIHIEPRERKIVVRYRVDGILQDVVTFSRPLHELVISRIKVLSRLRTDEHFSAQDGKFRMKFEGGKLDIRVSIVPTIKGEKAVLRLLSEQFRRFSIEELGLRDQDAKKLRASAKKPFGMILATGPTGSGKTTTLYGILKMLNKPAVNIATIEDPVEYDIEGVSQIQVNPKTNLTFAKGLRAIVRQDPDIIMVGEIRDEETAGIAINSAMTGHLVLSTLHTINAATTLPRLIDMEIEPFLISSSVNVICAQRLMRKICLQCIESYGITKNETSILMRDKRMQQLFLELGGKKELKGLRFYRGKGCKSCGGIGYAGRIGIFEVLEVDDSIRDLIMDKADADSIDKRARENGMTSMFYDGAEKVLEGVTTLEELLRVTRE